MKYRGIVFLTEDFTDEWLGWAKSGELTNIGLHKLAIPGTNSIDSLLNELDDGFRRRVDKFEKADITVEYELHALEWLLPRALFKEKPELFRVHAGARASDMNCCVSNSEALDIISERAYGLAKKLNQNSHNYYYWTDDAYDSFCACEKCGRLSGADQNMILVNAMLRGVKAYDGKAKMAYLAYGAALTVPGIKADGGVFLEFAPMDRDHNKPMDSPDEERGKKYIKLLEQLLTVFKADEVHVLEYWLDNALYSGYKYPPVKAPFRADVMEEDVKLYASYGINSIKSFGSFIGGEYYRLHGDPPIKTYGDILKKY